MSNNLLQLAHFVKKHYRLLLFILKRIRFSFTETCRCPQTFYTNWFLFDPYIVTSQSGIFPPLVKRMIRGVCGLCKAYNDTVLVNFTTDGKGRMARKNSSKLVQLVKTEDVTQFSYPVAGPITGSTGRSGSFIPVIFSPESVFISRKPVISTVAQTAIGETVIDALPFFAFMFVVMFLGGILIWAVVSTFYRHMIISRTCGSQYQNFVKMLRWGAVVSAPPFLWSKVHDVSPYSQ